MGKSKPLEDACKHTPRSAHAEIIQEIYYMENNIFYFNNLAILPKRSG